jgi:hypothetical protein
MESLHECLFSHREFREGMHWYRRVNAANEVIITEGERGMDILPGETWDGQGYGLCRTLAGWNNSSVIQ